MMSKKIIISLTIIVVAAVLLSVAFYFLIFFKKNSAPIIPLKEQSSETQTTTPPVIVQNESPFKAITLKEIMDIIKTDKDYNSLSGFLKDFDPKLATYIRLGPKEYEAIKPVWQKKGFDGRIDLIDKITLTDSTYWAEIANKNGGDKKLLALLDITSPSPLLLIVSMSVTAGVGI